MGEQLVDGLAVRLAAGGLHHGAHEHARHFGLTGAELLPGFGVVLDGPVHEGCKLLVLSMALEAECRSDGSGVCHGIRRS